MKPRYTLSECWKLLGADNKSLQRWLERAKIVPQTSEADHRTKYLTHDQLQQLATFLGRELPIEPPPDEEVAPVGAYKLLLDQVQELHLLTQRFHTQLEGIQADIDQVGNTAHDAWNQADHVQDRALRAVDELRIELLAKMDDMQQLFTLQHQQHEALADLINTQQRGLSDHKAEIVGQIEQMDHRFQARLEGFTQTLSQRDDEISERLQRLETNMSQQFQDVWGTLKKAEDLGTLQAEQLNHQVKQIAQAQREIAALKREFEQERAEQQRAALSVQTQLEKMNARLETIAEQSTFISSLQSDLKLQIDQLTAAYSQSNAQEQPPATKRRRKRATENPMETAKEPEASPMSTHTKMVRGSLGEEG